MIFEKTAFQCTDNLHNVFVAALVNSVFFHAIRSIIISFTIRFIHKRSGNGSTTPTEESIQPSIRPVPYCTSSQRCGIQISSIVRRRSVQTSGRYCRLWDSTTLFNAHQERNEDDTKWGGQQARKWSNGLPYRRQKGSLTPATT